VRARRAVRVARGNLAWAFGYNAVGVALAASGRLTPVFAASAMVVSSVLVALRAARLAED
jgi:Cu2+-exporting ATPase